MSIADEFRAILTRETHLSRAVIETVSFDTLARLMDTELGKDRVRDLGWSHIVDAYLVTA